MRVKEFDGIRAEPQRPFPPLGAPRGPPGASRRIEDDSKKMYRVGPNSKLWANFRALAGIFSQSFGPNLAIWASLIQFSFVEDDGSI
jgi:hypothetical protein